MQRERRGKVSGTKKVSLPVGAYGVEGMIFTTPDVVTTIVIYTLEICGNKIKIQHMHTHKVIQQKQWNV